jgi:hypothetical protein
MYTAILPLSPNCPFLHFDPNYTNKVLTQRARNARRYIALGAGRAVRPMANDQRPVAHDSPSPCTPLPKASSQLEQAAAQHGRRRAPTPPPFTEGRRPAVNGSAVLFSALAASCENSNTQHPMRHYSAHPMAVSTYLPPACHWIRTQGNMPKTSQQSLHGKSRSTGRAYVGQWAGDRRRRSCDMAQQRHIDAQRIMPGPLQRTPSLQLPSAHRHLLGSH